MRLRTRRTGQPVETLSPATPSAPDDLLGACQRRSSPPWPFPEIPPRPEARHLEALVWAVELTDPLRSGR